MRRAACVVVGLVLLGCSPVPDAQKAVAAELRDPSSAQFRLVRAGENGAVCGEVNGKNGYGAYNGFRRFIYSAGAVEMSPDYPSEPFNPGVSSNASMAEWKALTDFRTKWSDKCDRPIDEVMADSAAQLHESDAFMERLKTFEKEPTKSGSEAPPQPAAEQPPVAKAPAAAKPGTRPPARFGGG